MNFFKHVISFFLVVGDISCSLPDQGDCDFFLYSFLIAQLRTYQICLLAQTFPVKVFVTEIDYLKLNILFNSSLSF